MLAITNKGNCVREYCPEKPTNPSIMMGILVGDGGDIYLGVLFFHIFLIRVVVCQFAGRRNVAAECKNFLANIDTFHKKFVRGHCWFSIRPSILQ